METVKRRWRCVVVESPYKGDIERNLAYLRACMRDCIERGESPYASHGLLPLPGVLRDAVPEERMMGIEAGLAWAEHADAVIFYTDFGMTQGMRLAEAEHRVNGRVIEYRELPPHLLVRFDLVAHVEAHAAEKHT